MSKPTKDINPVSFIYSNYFRNLKTEHELGLEEGLGGKVDRVLVEPHKTFEKEQNGDHPDSDVFGSNHVKTSPTF